MDAKDTLRPRLDSAVAPLGLVVDDLVITPMGARSVVKVVVDRTLPDEDESTEPTPALSLDEVALATSAVSDVLDGEDAMGEAPYTLEVTSPGVSRPLTQSRHYRLNVGRLVTLTRHEGPPVTGRIVRAGHGALTIATIADKKTPSQEVTIAYDEVRKGNVEVEFNRS